MNNGFWNVCIYNIETGEESILSQQKIHQYAPQIWDDKVIWVEHITEDKENIVYKEI
jgi:hypothetical protein